MVVTSSSEDVGCRSDDVTQPIQADGFGSQRAVLIDAGAGSVHIEGDQVASGDGVGLRFGNLNHDANVAITSSSAQAPAIKIIGTSAHDRGIWLGDDEGGSGSTGAGGTVLIQSTSTSGGGILLEGSSSQATNEVPGLDLSGSTTGGGQEYQFLSNSGPIELFSKRDTQSSWIQIKSDFYLGQRKDTTPVQGVTPIAGAAVLSRFQADRKVAFDGQVFGSGTVEISPYTSGRSIALGTGSGDLEIVNLDKLSSAFSSLTIGSSSTNGIDAAFSGTATLNNNALFNSGTGGFQFSGSLTSTDNDLTLQTSGDSSIGSLVLGTGSLIKQGTGTVSLTTANSYTGHTTLNEGVLDIANSDALGQSSVMNIDGGTLKFSVPVSADSGSIVLGSGGATFEVNDGVTADLSAVVSGSGSVVKSGAGSFALARRIPMQEQQP